MPSMYRIYSLCAIYRLELDELLSWYGISLAQLPADSQLVELPREPMSSDLRPETRRRRRRPWLWIPGIDLSKTEFLSRMIQRWGKLPLTLLNRVDLRNHRYGFVGTEDWFMYPIIPPGSLGGDRRQPAPRR